MGLGYFMVLALRGTGDEQSKPDLGMKLGPKICTLQQKVEMEILGHALAGVGLQRRTTADKIAYHNYYMPPITEIRFVEEAPGRAREGGTESVVRSHVARFRYRRRRDADVRAFRRTRDEVEDRIVQEKTTLARDKPVRASIQPSLLYQDNLIPYTFLSATGPVLMLPRTSALFSRLASRDPDSPVLFPRQSIWMPKAALPEPSKIESTILGLELVDWISNTPSCFQFRLETIKWIQDRLSDSELATKDDTLGAIITLTMWESYRAQLKPSDVVAHMNGLERVVDLRGGLDSMPLVQADKIALFDHIIAAITLQQPRFPLRCRAGPTSPSKARLYNSPIFGSLPFSSFIKNTGADTQICTLLEALRDLTNATISDVQFYKLHIDVKAPCTTDSIYKALHAAGQIYAAALSSPSFFTSPFSLPWLHILSASMDRTICEPFWRENPGVRLWALLVGAAATVARAERGFFMMYLARASLFQGWENEMAFRKWCVLFSRKRSDYGDGLL
ncbi:hypothetical protein V500_10924 [Pseudogymnoascus sp. VKM F-4518 (FW-2643)]|nr:hypothetical protein V500_10924 [Pseudogymnoascus sp. VKM F-4518 (FW-2643)]